MHSRASHITQPIEKRSLLNSLSAAVQRPTDAERPSAILVTVIAAVVFLAHPLIYVVAAQVFDFPWLFIVPVSLCFAAVVGFLLWRHLQSVELQSVMRTNDMLRVYSHDLRNPLASLQLLFDDLGSMGPDEIAVAIPMLEKALTRLSTTIDRYSGNANCLSPQRTAPAKFNAAFAVKAAIDEHRREFGAAPALVELETLQDVALMGQEPDLRRVLVQLLQNAYTAVSQLDDRKLGRITVSVVAIDGEAGITVKDNGIGIPKKQLGRVWEPFFSTRGPGHGLGLFYVRHIVSHRLGGSIQISSELGNGTSVQVILPAQKD